MRAGLMTANAGQQLEQQTRLTMEALYNTCMQQQSFKLQGFQKFDCLAYFHRDNRQLVTKHASANTLVSE